MLLVALDIEGCASLVVEQAQVLALALGESLTLCTAVDLPPGLSVDAHLAGFEPERPPLALLEKEAKAALESLSASARAAGISVRTQVLDGPPVEAVLAAVDTFQPHMLVVGTHGRRGLERFFLGSVAERIIRESTLPVLVVPGPGTEPHPSALRMALSAEGDG